ncbi:MAG: tRNA guanosine(34) transglycosylase Tgt, partial [Lachnospiraceae bacterium]|nr:tRNA guanosine(34) transglycosylase Tgt [Lachnospiraceae bacterium]
ADEILGLRLCVLHNLYFYNKMMSEIRCAIEKHDYKNYKQRKLEGMISGE